MKLAASNFARTFVDVLGRESPILGKFAPQKPKIGLIGARQVDVGSACCITVSPFTGGTMLSDSVEIVYAEQISSLSLSHFSERELTFTFAIYIARPSVVCLSVCNVRTPYSAG